jgi:hypothetical protein
VGKEETDDEVERATVQHIRGYYVIIEQLDKFGVVRKLRKWIPGDAHAGLKWLAARRPEVYREQKNVRHALSADDAFLRFLDQMDEEQKLKKAERARAIEHMRSSDRVSESSALIDEADQVDSADDSADR